MFFSVHVTRRHYQVLCFLMYPSIVVSAVSRQAQELAEITQNAQRTVYFT